MLRFISTVLGPCFKSLNNNRIQSLSKAIACVALGLRTCHLLDIALLNLTQAKKLLNQLYKHPSCRSLVLIQFKENFTFIGHRNRLKDHLKSVDNLIYISVQGKEPVKLYKTPCQLIYWLDQLQSILFKNQNVFYSDIVPTCMVSFIGWALEYPIIYTTHLESDKATDQLDEWEQRSNCLGDRYLQLCQLWLNDHMLLSYSYPIMEGLNDIQDLILRDKVNQRLSGLNLDWLPRYCELKKERVKLDRFAL